jgi:glycerol 3-phosphatase-2
VIIERYGTVLLDLDGVVHRGDRVVPAAAATLADLRRRGTRILFLTNNSSRTPQQVAGDLERLGVVARPEEILTSALATAAMLRREGFAGAEVFVIGEEGIRSALRDAGLRLRDGEPAQTDVVVIGWDRAADYGKLRRAALLVQRGARLVATNADAAYPGPDGLWPGAGAILAAVTTTTGASPEVVGKPARPLFEAAVELTGDARPLVVGDRLETDIGGAEAMGWDSLLVLTGAAGVEDVTRSPHAPTYLGRDLAMLLEEAPRGRFEGASPRDGEAVRRLLRRARLSDADAEGRIASTLVCWWAGPDRSHRELAATVCVEPVGESSLLRSLAVREEVRSRGLGALAVAAAVRVARSTGSHFVYLFTETAAEFFERLGFRALDRSRLPAAVRSSPQAIEECAASATPMSLRL